MIADIAEHIAKHVASRLWHEHARSSSDITWSQWVCLENVERYLKMVLKAAKLIHPAFLSVWKLWHCKILQGTTRWSTLENARKEQPPLPCFSKTRLKMNEGYADMLDIHGHPMTSSEAVNLVGLLCQIFVRFSRHFFRVALRSLVTCPLPSASLNPAATALGKFVRALAPTKCNAHLCYGMIWIDDIKINT